MVPAPPLQSDGCRQSGVEKMTVYSPKTLTAATALAASAVVVHAESLSPEEAAEHVGSNVTVCGLVSSATYATRLSGEPTFINLGKPYPDQEFTVVIFGTDRAKFGMPEVSLRGKRVCVTGDIRLFRGRPEIILHDPKQLTEK
jgi:DNA/RNA endonuclease YhcR with UshA esterase domain